MIEIGWSPDQVLLRLKKGLLNAEAILTDPIVREALESRERDRQKRGEGSILRPPDGTKFAVVDASSPFLDVEDFTATLQATRYFSVLRARPAIEESFEIRRQCGHVEPAKNRAPQSIAI